METETVTTFDSGPGFPLLTTGPLWLLILLVVGLGGWWLWRKRRMLNLPANGAIQISVLATRPLGPRSHLVIVEAAGHRSLIATTAQGVHYLRDLPADPSAPTAGADFAAHLANEKETPS